eukprot:scaffold51859_cov60-Phaeocystis_antarctica.AAC.2
MPHAAGGRAATTGGRADLRPQRGAAHAAAGGGARPAAARLTGRRERHAARHARAHHCAV